MTVQKKAMISRVASGIVDVFVTSGNELNTVGLVPNCGGALDNNLGFIADGTIVTLRRGSITRKVTLRIGDASECVANSLDVSMALARMFRLRNQTRFLLTYNTATKTLTMRRKRVTVDTLPLLLTANSNMRRDQVTIGLGLARRDGNYLNNGALLTLRHGNKRSKLRMVLLNDIFNNDFKLHPAVIRMLGLAANKKYKIAYNQVKRELVFIRQVN